ncbi:MAG: VWA domain-containing protein [Phycisphaerales bacterium]
MNLPAVHLGEPAWLHALWAIPAVALLLLWSWRRSRCAAAAFAGEAAAAEPARARALRLLRAGTVLGALALLALALARPQWDPREEEVAVQGRDVVFLVDVSRSMLARDVAPSRLARAKLWIGDVAGSLRGDRVALVAFAGAASVKCPLTLDYGYFRMALGELAPESVPRGGTLIGDALRKTVAEAFDDAAGRGRDIILITDGEDHESFPVEAAAQAGEKGIRIIALGIGSETGSPVPGSGNTTLTHEGEQVRSRLEAASLAQVAAASRAGVFFNVGTGTIDLERVYQDLIGDAEKSELGKRATVRYEEKFQLFLGASLGLLMLEVFLRAR